jgi:hypothetical protein
MNTKALRNCVLGTTAALALAACGGGASEEASDSEAEADVETASVEVAFPDSVAAFGDGYPNSGDPCRRLGEGSATVDWLDDSATLVGCPTPEAAAALGGNLVGQVEGITVLSIPTGDANEGMPGEMPVMSSPVATPAAPAKPAADPGSRAALEAKCKAAVESTTGAKVARTISGSFSQAGTLFQFEVAGAQAPWQCIGYSDGSTGGVMYTGDEGAL